MICKLLVITPSLGRSRYLGRTIESICEQASESYRVLVCPSSVLLGLKAENHSLVNGDWQVLEEPAACRGLYEAINYAVSNCHYDGWTHLTYINDDDLLGDAFGGVLETHFKANANAFGYGRVALIDGESKVSSQVPTESNPRWFEALLAEGISPLNQQGMIIPRELWDRLGGFRTEYKLCADLDFWLRAHRIGWPFAYYSAEVGRFRIHDGQLSGDTSKLESEIDRVVSSGVPRNISRLERFYARWQFRIKNAPIYFARLVAGRRLRGMKMLSGK